jgi:TPR repeat protein
MMRCLILLAIPLLLAACTAPAVDTDPAQLRAEARDAFEGGDTRAGLRLLRQAARAGDIYALRTLAEAHTVGSVSYAAPREARHFAVPTYPWSATRWRRAYARELQRRVDAGDPEALMLRADELLNAHVRIGQRSPVSARDSSEAVAILTGLADAGNTEAMLRLGFAAIARDRERAGDWFRQASRAGNAQACWFTLYFIDGVAAHTEDPARLAHALDRAEDCRALASARQPGVDGDFAADVLRGLAEQARAGNHASAALLDSLHARGTFDRHPRLAPIAARP